MKVLKKLLVLVCVFCSLIPFASGCKGDAGGSATGSSSLLIGEAYYGFITQDEYDPETFTKDVTKKMSKLEVDTAYYLWLTFDVTARRDNDGQSLLKVNIKFENTDVFDGTVNSAASGRFEEMSFEDATTGEPGKISSVSFSIPPLAAAPRTITMKVGLTPRKVGRSHILIGYEYDEPGMLLQGAGVDGNSQDIEIVSVQIGKPSLEVDTIGANSVLKWKHMKNADYYCVYDLFGTQVSGQSVPWGKNPSEIPLVDEEGRTLMILAEGVAVGADIIIPISEMTYIYGTRRLRIRAFSDNSSIEPSDYSDYIDVTFN